MSHVVNEPRSRSHNTSLVQRQRTLCTPVFSPTCEMDMPLPQLLVVNAGPLEEKVQAMAKGVLPPIIHGTQAALVPTDHRHVYETLDITVNSLRRVSAKRIGWPNITYTIRNFLCFLLQKLPDKNHAHPFPSLSVQSCTLPESVVEGLLTADEQMQEKMGVKIVGNFNRDEIEEQYNWLYIVMGLFLYERIMSDPSINEYEKARIKNYWDGNGDERTKVANRLYFYQFYIDRKIVSSRFRCMSTNGEVLRLGSFTITMLHSHSKEKSRAYLGMEVDFLGYLSHPLSPLLFLGESNDVQIILSFLQSSKFQLPLTQHDLNPSLLFDLALFMTRNVTAICEQSKHAAIKAWVSHYQDTNVLYDAIVSFFLANHCSKKPRRPVLFFYHLLSLLPQECVIQRKWILLRMQQHILHSQVLSLEDMENVLELWVFFRLYDSKRGLQTETTSFICGADIDGELIRFWPAEDSIARALRVVIKVITLPQKMQEVFYGELVKFSSFMGSSDAVEGAYHPSWNKQLIMQGLDFARLSQLLANRPKEQKQELIDFFSSLAEIEMEDLASFALENIILSKDIHSLPIRVVTSFWEKIPQNQAFLLKIEALYMMMQKGEQIGVWVQSIQQESPSSAEVLIALHKLLELPLNQNVKHEVYVTLFCFLREACDLQEISQIQRDTYSAFFEKVVVNRTLFEQALNYLVLDFPALHHLDVEKCRIMMQHIPERMPFTFLGLIEDLLHVPNHADEIALEPPRFFTCASLMMTSEIEISELSKENAIEQFVSRYPNVMDLQTSLQNYMSMHFGQEDGQKKFRFLHCLHFLLPSEQIKYKDCILAMMQNEIPGCKFLSFEEMKSIFTLWTLSMLCRFAQESHKQNAGQNLIFYRSMPFCLSQESIGSSLRQAVTTMCLPEKHQLKVYEGLQVLTLFMDKKSLHVRPLDGRKQLLQESFTCIRYLTESETLLAKLHGEIIEFFSGLSTIRLGDLAVFSLEEMIFLETLISMPIQIIKECWKQISRKHEFSIQIDALYTMIRRKEKIDELLPEVMETHPSTVEAESALRKLLTLPIEQKVGVESYIELFAFFREVLGNRELNIDKSKYKNFLDKITILLSPDDVTSRTKLLHYILLDFTVLAKKKKGALTTILQRLLIPVDSNVAIALITHPYFCKVAHSLMEDEDTEKCLMHMICRVMLQDKSPSKQIKRIIFSFFNQLKEGEKTLREENDQIFSDYVAQFLLRNPALHSIRDFLRQYCILQRVSPQICPGFTDVLMGYTQQEKLLEEVMYFEDEPLSIWFLDQGPFAPQIHDTIWSRWWSFGLDAAFAFSYWEQLEKRESEVLFSLLIREQDEDHIEDITRGWIYCFANQAKKGLVNPLEIKNTFLATAKKYLTSEEKRCNQPNMELISIQLLIYAEKELCKIIQEEKNDQWIKTWIGILCKMHLELLDLQNKLFGRTPEFGKKMIWHSNEILSVLMIYEYFVPVDYRFPDLVLQINDTHANNKIMLSSREKDEINFCFTSCLFQSLVRDSFIKGWNFYDTIAMIPCQQRALCDEVMLAMLRKSMQYFFLIDPYDVSSSHAVTNLSELLQVYRAELIKKNDELALGKQNLGLLLKDKAKEKECKALAQHLREVKAEISRLTTFIELGQQINEGDYSYNKEDEVEIYMCKLLREFSFWLKIKKSERQAVMNKNQDFFKCLSCLIIPFYKHKIIFEMYINDILLPLLKHLSKENDPGSIKLFIELCYAPILNSLSIQEDTKSIIANLVGHLSLAFPQYLDEPVVCVWRTAITRDMYHEQQKLALHDSLGGLLDYTMQLLRIDLYPKEGLLLPQHFKELFVGVTKLIGKREEQSLTLPDAITYLGIDLILAHRSDARYRERWQSTPIFTSLQKHYPEIMERLLEEPALDQKCALFLHWCAEQKKEVLQQVAHGNDMFTMLSYGYSLQEKLMEVTLDAYCPEVGAVLTAQHFLVLDTILYANYPKGHLNKEYMEEIIKIVGDKIKNSHYFQYYIALSERFAFLTRDEGGLLKLIAITTNLNKTFFIPCLKSKKINISLMDARMISAIRLFQRMIVLSEDPPSQIALYIQEFCLSLLQDITFFRNDEESDHKTLISVIRWVMGASYMLTVCEKYHGHQDCRNINLAKERIFESLQDKIINLNQTYKGFLTNVKKSLEEEYHGDKILLNKVFMSDKLMLQRLESFVIVNIFAQNAQAKLG